MYCHGSKKKINVYDWRVNYIFLRRDLYGRDKKEARDIISKPNHKKNINHIIYEFKGY